MSKKFCKNSPWPCHECKLVYIYIYLGIYIGIYLQHLGFDLYTIENGARFLLECWICARPGRIQRVGSAYFINPSSGVRKPLRIHLAGKKAVTRSCAVAPTFRATEGINCQRYSLQIITPNLTRDDPSSWEDYLGSQVLDPYSINIYVFKAWIYIATEL